MMGRERRQWIPEDWRIVRGLPKTIAAISPPCSLFRSDYLKLWPKTCAPAPSDRRELVVHRFGPPMPLLPLKRGVGGLQFSHGEDSFGGPGCLIIYEPMRALVARSWS